MALNASLSVVGGPGGANVAAIFMNTPVNGVLVLSNTGPQPVVVQTIQPWARGTGQPNSMVYAQREVTLWAQQPWSPAGQPPFNPQTPNTVPAGGTLTYSLSYVLPSPIVAGPGIDANDPYFDLGATIYSNDATNPVLSPPVYQVIPTSPVPVPAGGQGGKALSQPSQGSMYYDLNFAPFIGLIL